MQGRRQICSVGYCAAALVACLVVATSVFAQSARPPVDIEQLKQREIIVGTKEAAPFAMKLPGGEWTGISIDL
jgi:ABC-type amino acid transport substrate-binding protein